MGRIINYEKYPFRIMGEKIKKEEKVDYFNKLCKELVNG